MLMDPILQRWVALLARNICMYLRKKCLNLRSTFYKDASGNISNIISNTPQKTKQNKIKVKAETIKAKTRPSGR